MARRQKLSRFRVALIAMLWCMTAVGIALRMFELYRQGDFLRTMSDARVLRERVVKPERGRLQMGRVDLAWTLPYWSLAANPSYLHEHPEALRHAVEKEGLDLVDFTHWVEARKDKSFVWIERLREKAEDRFAKPAAPQGLYKVLDQKRLSLQEDGLDLLIGKTDIDGHGIGGLEYVFEEALKGKEGRERFLTGPRGEMIEMIESEKKQDGSAVRLSLSPCLQHHASIALQKALTLHHAKRAAAVALDVRTGAVLALAHAHDMARVDKQTPWALIEAIEPGSMFKPIAMGYILESLQLSAQHTVDTGKGEWKLGKHTISDIHAYGTLSIVDVIAKSSNIGMAKLMLKTPKGFEKWLKESWQVLKKTALQFPGEPHGFMITNPKPFEIATIAFGYGVNMTIVQLARAYLTLANGGVFKEVCWHACADMQKEQTKPVLSKKNHAMLVEMLIKASGITGTGFRAKTKGVQVAGKTGTMHKLKKGSYSDAYMVGYAGFAPAKAPKVVVVVFVDEPKGKQYYGGHVAAPVFNEIVFASRYLCKPHA